MEGCESLEYPSGCQPGYTCCMKYGNFGEETFQCIKGDTCPPSVSDTLSKGCPKLGCKREYGKQDSMYCKKGTDCKKKY